MHPSVEKYIEELQLEIAKLHELQKKEHMRSLNLMEEKKVYHDSDTPSFFGIGFSQKKEVVDGVQHVYHIEKSPVEISDNDYTTLCELIAERDRLKNASKNPEPHEPPFQVEMTSGSSSSNAASFLKVMAWILWIGGFILANLTANVDTGYETEFSWTIFFTTFLTYTLYGGLVMCAAELFTNIQAIRDALVSIRFKKSDRS